MAATATPVHTDVIPVVGALQAIHAITFGVVVASFTTESGSHYEITKNNTRLEYITDSPAVPPFGYVHDAYLLHRRLVIVLKGRDGSLDRITTSPVVERSIRSL